MEHPFFDRPIIDDRASPNKSSRRRRLGHLNSAIFVPFPKPESGRIAVKIIHHLGDEVMKMFRAG